MFFHDIFSSNVKNAILQNLSSRTHASKNLHVSIVRKNTNIMKKITKNRRFFGSRRLYATKSPKNWFREGLGLHLGGVWDGLERLLGVSGRSGASLGRFLIVFFSVGIQLFKSIGPTWLPRELSNPFGVELGRFWNDLECFWGGFSLSWTLLGFLGPLLGTS